MKAFGKPFGKPISAAVVAPSAKPLAALQRGLGILEDVLLNGEKRFSELKAGSVLTDASLNRLLKSLLTTGHLIRSEEGGYREGPRLKWLRNALQQNGEEAAWEFHGSSLLERLHRRGGESIGFAQLEKDRIVLRWRENHRESVHIVPPGTVLHFEKDHAAVLCILDSLSPTERTRLISGPYSRIPSTASLIQALKRSRWEGAYRDRSRSRPGISRLAVSLATTDGPAAVFFCTTVEQLNRRGESLRDLLLNEKYMLQNSHPNLFEEEA